MTMNVKSNLTIAALAACFVLIPAVASALPALEEWNNVARLALPTYVKIWLGMMLLTNIAALAFVKKHVAARWVFVGFAISHAIGMFFWSKNIPVLAGQISLLHVVFWAPGAIMLLRRRAEIKIPTAYGIWACLSLFFYVGSMLVDIPAGLTAIKHMFG
ncbi:hypothetical protein [Yoonia sp. I 8.24]|uniref:hypothetical protein n=1 Tax=Yoonia sp. I 8.24 TaxID=1537229 RepID=UPI001EE03D29|nr:hypothetical protein [Yoonia sp. I 8.24]MCG3269530.1 hypothetical protein [Yoonia sp. I 8.24]